MVVIDGHGGYVPLYRVDRGAIASQHGDSASGESAVPGRDENHVTMAVEAAENALARADPDGGDLEAVFSASVSDPFAEHGISAHVAYRIGATGDVRTGDFRATPRAGSDALVAAREFVAAGGGSALVVAADVMPVEPGHDDEPYAGAGAGAVVLSEDVDEPAAEIAAVGQETTGFVERHREHGEAPDAGDSKFAGKYGFGPAAGAATERALAELGDEPGRAVVGTPNQRAAGSALREFDGVERVSTFDDVGYAGAASLLLDLAALLEAANPGETALAVSHGAGGADAVALETGDGVGTDGATAVDTYLDSKEEVTYAKHLEYREEVEYKGVVTP